MNPTLANQNAIVRTAPASESTDTVIIKQVQLDCCLQQRQNGAQTKPKLMTSLHSVPFPLNASPSVVGMKLPCLFGHKLPSVFQLPLLPVLKISHWFLKFCPASSYDLHLTQMGEFIFFLSLFCLFQIFFLGFTFDLSCGFFICSVGTAPPHTSHVKFQYCEGWNSPVFPIISSHIFPLPHIFLN